MRLLRSILAFSLLPCLAVAYPFYRSSQLFQYPDPEPCQGVCQSIHDPTIIRKDDTYYRFVTGGKINVATAKSLSGPWEENGVLLEDGQNIFADTTCNGGGVVGVDCFDVWAPDINQIGDTFFAFYAVSKIGYRDSQIGVATSPSMEPGSWTDYGSIGIPQSDSYNIIDPNLFQEDGEMYFTFGSYWDDIFQFNFPSFMQLPLDLSTVIPNNIIRNTTYPEAVSEGGFQWKNGDQYYIFFSVGQCCREESDLAPAGDEYRISVCRSDSIGGPYIDQMGASCLESGGTTVLESHGNVYAPGGQGVMTDDESQLPVLYYHYVDKTIGYAGDQFMFGWNYLDFSSGWPVVTSTGERNKDS